MSETIRDDLFFDPNKHERIETSTDGDVMKELREMGKTVSEEEQKKVGRSFFGGIQSLPPHLRQEDGE